MFVLERLRRREQPVASIGIAAITVIFFLVEVVLTKGGMLSPFGMGGPDAGEVVRRLGACSNFDVWKQREVYRILCCNFLHFGLLHILMNGWGFYMLAPLVEKIWGSARFLVIYVLCCMGCGIAASLRPGLSVGASGGVFGLVGFLLAAQYGRRQRHEVRALLHHILGPQLVTWTLFNLYLSMGPNISMAGHLGGLIVGLLLGLVIVEVRREETPTLVAGGAAVLAIVAAFVLCFFWKSAPSVDEVEARAVRAFEKGDSLEKTDPEAAKASFAAAATGFENAVVLDPSHAAMFIYNSALSWQRAGRLENARSNFERAWELRADAKSALGIAEIDLDRGRAADARTWIERAEQGGADVSDLRKRLAAIAPVESGRAPEAEKGDKR